MAYRDLNSPELKHLPNFSDYLTTPLVAAEFEYHPARAKMLLQCFRESMR